MDQSLEINIASLALLGVFLVVSLVLTLLLICRIPYSKVREGLFWVRLSAILINLFLILYIVTLGMQHVDSSGWGNAYRSSLRNAFYIIPRIQHFFLHLSAAAVIVSQLSLVPHSRTRTARLAGAGLGAIVAVLAVAVMGLTISFDFRGSASTSSWSDVLERHQASAAINFVVFLLLVLGAASSLLWTLAVGYFPGRGWLIGLTVVTFIRSLYHVIISGMQDIGATHNGDMVHWDDYMQILGVLFSGLTLTLGLGLVYVFLTRRAVAAAY